MVRKLFESVVYCLNSVSRLNCSGGDRGGICVASGGSGVGDGGRIILVV